MYVFSRTFLLYVCHPVAPMDHFLSSSGLATKGLRSAGRGACVPSPTCSQGDCASKFLVTTPFRDEQTRGLTRLTGMLESFVGARTRRAFALHRIGLQYNPGMRIRISEVVRVPSYRQWEVFAHGMALESCTFVSICRLYIRGMALP
jgi:hypothetical protein